MSVGVEALFTSALGLKSPWEVVKVDLDTGKRRIDFEVARNAKQLPCPACGVNGQGIHDRVRRDCMVAHATAGGDPRFSSVLHWMLD